MEQEWIDRIAEPAIREGVRAAVEKTLMPAMSAPVYPGHFTVTADGGHFGSDITWPGLDSWEMAGAYLLLGFGDAVRDYFAFVKAAQRADGNVPFAVFPGETEPAGRETYLLGMRWPEDVYEYGGRKWVGLFDHWQVRVNPLSVLAPICFVLTAGEMAEWQIRNPNIEIRNKPRIQISEAEKWLAENLESVERAGRYLLSRKSGNGLVGGAGFYIECPPRNQWDGVTQCYAVKALRVIGELCARVGERERGAEWEGEARELADTFNGMFWRGDHFAEYVHPERGVVDLRGLTDVNFAAVGLGVASDEQARVVWERIKRERSFWVGGMPTQLVAEPARYEQWEWPEELPFEHVNGPLYDVGAMGRVWYLEALACARMGDWERLAESVRLVCGRGLADGGMWYERYHARDGEAVGRGPRGYCEYAAVLVRVVHLGMTNEQSQ